MKKPLLLSIIFSITCFSFVFATSNFTIEAAMDDANVSFDSIIYETEYDDAIIILYIEGDTLSSGKLTKNGIDYTWHFGGGYTHFADEAVVTYDMTNFLDEEDGDYISIMNGLIQDEEIESLTLHYPAGDVDATIFEHNGYRIWYAFSETPLNAPSDVTRTYKDGTTAMGWH